MTWLNSNSALSGAFLCAGPPGAERPRTMLPYQYVRLAAGVHPPHSFGGRRGCRITTKHTEITEKVYSAVRRPVSVISVISVVKFLDAPDKPGHDGFVNHGDGEELTIPSP